MARRNLSLCRVSDLRVMLTGVVDPKDLGLGSLVSGSDDVS